MEVLAINIKRKYGSLGWSITSNSLKKHNKTIHTSTEVAAVNAPLKSNENEVYNFLTDKHTKIP